MNIEIIEDYKPLLSEYFAADEALINQWHVFAGKGLDACVQKTFEDLKALKVTFFNIVDGKRPVGYFCKEMFQGKEVLTGFFLIPEYRTEERKARFWELVRASFHLPFLCGVFEKNAPANKFIKSHGGFPVVKSTLTDGEAVFYKLGA